MPATETQRRVLIDGSRRFREARRMARLRQWQHMEDGTYRIPLQEERFAIISAEDYQLASRYIWALARPKTAKTFYAQASVPGSGSVDRKILLHRLIMRAVDGEEIDHKDRNGLNCVRENLRKCNGSQNCSNRPYKRSKALYRGTDPLPSGRTRAFISVDRKQKHLGVFDTPEEAALVYNAAAVATFGEFATLNVIGDSDGH